MMRTFAATLLVVHVAALLAGRALHAQESVSFSTRDGGCIHAHAYGAGEHGVVLAHGGRFDKESWQMQARRLAEAGFRVLAIDFRGYGASTGPGHEDPLDAPLHLDVLAAVEYLRQGGATTISAIGGSMGADAVAQASADVEAEQIDRLVLLAGGAYAPPERMRGRKLFIVSLDDLEWSGTPRLVRIRKQYEKAPGPKELVILEGNAHAQFIFETDQSESVMNEILRFLTAR